MYNRRKSTKFWSSVTQGRTVHGIAISLTTTARPSTESRPTCIHIYTCGRGFARAESFTNHRFALLCKCRSRGRGVRVILMYEERSTSLLSLMSSFRHGRAFITIRREQSILHQYPSVRELGLIVPPTRTPLRAYVSGARLHFSQFRSSCEDQCSRQNHYSHDLEVSTLIYLDENVACAEG